MNSILADKESVKVALAYAPNVEIAHSGLMNSPGHRKNILTPGFRRIGIGVVDGGLKGEMFTQNFTD